MKALLLTAVIWGVAISPLMAQKKSTVFGDLMIGELTGKDEATREITIKFPGKEGPEIFSGILADGYKLKVGDGSNRDLTLNDFVPGMHIRAFYKSGKINKISRLEFLGKDEYSRLRTELNVDPSTIVVLAETDNLPARSPLKIYPAIFFKNIQADFVESIDKWNQKNGDAHGKLEVVSNFEQADVMIVAAPGSDTMVAVIPDFNKDPDAVKTAWAHATLYLAVKDSGGVKVLWTRIAPIAITQDMQAWPRSFEPLMAELEKRMKARSRNSKK
jgi:hypothetical protein